MCGITGFYSLKANREDGQCRAIGGAMEQAIAHRGPDANDIWLDPDMPLVFAHRRLAIIDLSDAGRQPMHSASGRYVIVTNGEIYNYLELQAELEAEGCTFRSRSDTEVMLVAFEHWGINFALQKFNGMFAFSLWDRKEKQLHFVRDRFGKKPLYVGWAGNDLVFGSELSSLQAHPDFKKSINPNALSIYMHYGYMQAPFSIFDNVWQMLPASRMTLDVSSLQAGENLAEKMQLYWSLKNVAEAGKKHQTAKSEAEIINEFEAKLEHATAQRMLSDVPLGAFLSGGIDSSTIVSLMQKRASSAVKTFSIGFEENAYNEAEHAKEIARHLETDHQEFYVTGQDALDVIPKLPEIYDEPFSDSSQIPTYLISKLARDQVTVVLTGDGGDEILAGYDRHTKVADLWSKIGWIPAPLRRIFLSLLLMAPDALYGALKSGSPLYATKVKRALQLMKLSNAAEIYDALVSSWPANLNVVLNSKDPLIPLTDETYWPQNLDFAESMIYGDTLSYRPNDLMVKTDRATMAVALEARAPLMDYKLAEYSWSLPHHMKVRGGQGKWLLRQVLKRHVPENLYERPKMGFSVPLADWLRGPLKSWGADLLSPESLKAQGLLNADIIYTRWENFQQGATSQETPKDLWSALMFQAWFDRWMK